MSRVLEAVERHARSHPTRVALEDDAGALNYVELHTAVEASADLLARASTHSVALLAGNGRGWILADLAALRGGIPIVPRPTYMSLRQIGHAPRRAGVDHVLTPKAEGGFGALGKAKAARDTLLAAKAIDPPAMGGAVYSTLGSLYAKVPGWPIGFGDKKKARGLFEKALAIDPAGIDANFFYADFLDDQGEYRDAALHLQRGIVAPARAGREDADAGRRAEAVALLSTLREKHATDTARQ